MFSFDMKLSGWIYKVDYYGKIYNFLRRKVIELISMVIGNEKLIIKYLICITMLYKKKYWYFSAMKYCNSRFQERVLLNITWQHYNSLFNYVWHVKLIQVIKNISNVFSYLFLLLFFIQTWWSNQRNNVSHILYFD
jgi:hypothetical protein